VSGVLYIPFIHCRHNAKDRSLGVGRDIKQSFWTKVGRRTASTGFWWSSEQSTGVRAAADDAVSYWSKRRHSWVAVAESGRQTSEPPNSQRNFTWGGGSTDHQFRGLFANICVSSATRKDALNSWLKHTACMHALFSVCSLRENNVITSKPTWKMKHTNCILEPFEYFCRISSKLIHTISSYTVSTMGRFLDTV